MLHYANHFSAPSLTPIIYIASRYRINRAGSPAEKVGLKKSMILKRVDGYEVKDADVCGGYLRGEKGTKVGVTVSEEGRERDFIIVR